MPTEGEEHEFNPLKETFDLLHRQLDVLEKLWKPEVMYNLTLDPTLKTDSVQNEGG